MFVPGIFGNVFPVVAVAPGVDGVVFHVVGAGASGLDGIAVVLLELCQVLPVLWHGHQTTLLRRSPLS